MQRSDLKGMIFWIIVEEVLGLLLVSHWAGQGYLLGVDACDPMPWRPWVSLCPCQPGRLHSSVWEQDPEGTAHMYNKTYPYLSPKQGWAQHSELDTGHLQTQGCELNACWSQVMCHYVSSEHYWGKSRLTRPLRAGETDAQTFVAVLNRIYTLKIKPLYCLQVPSRAQGRRWPSWDSEGSSSQMRVLNHRSYQPINLGVCVHFSTKVAWQNSDTALNIVSPKTKDELNGWYLKLSTKYIIIKYIFRIFIIPQEQISCQLMFYWGTLWQTQ